MREPQVPAGYRFIVTIQLNEERLQTIFMKPKWHQNNSIIALEKRLLLLFLP